jgi:serine/threonine protein kinase
VSPFRIVYCDFGCAEYFDKIENPQALVSDSTGTLLYWAPECLNPAKYAYDIDVGLDLEDYDEKKVDNGQNNKGNETDDDLLDFSNRDQDSSDKLVGKGGYQYSAYSLDIWSLGVTCYNLFYHSFPFPIRGGQTKNKGDEDPSIMDQIQEICNSEPSFRLHPEYRKHSNGDWRDRGCGIIQEVLQGLLQKEPTMRWSLDNVFDRLESTGL